MDKGQQQLLETVCLSPVARAPWQPPCDDRPGGPLVDCPPPPPRRSPSGLRRRPRSFSSCGA
eukprot:4384852-Pyramimonas_sp.AAC.1